MNVFPKAVSAYTSSILEMLKLQDKMNSTVNPDWANAGNAWYRAIWLECGEMLDHIGWKWWKKQEPNIAQVKLELVDIWHFALSMYLEMYRTFTKTDIACTIRDDINIVVSKNLLPNDFGSADSKINFQLQLELFVQNTLYNKKYFDIENFLMLMSNIGMTFDELISQYIGKNVLNIFRQEHGYKTGHYRKHWFDDREDNEHLVEVLAALPASEQTYEIIYARLKELYLTPKTESLIVDPTYLG